MRVGIRIGKLRWFSKKVLLEQKSEDNPTIEAIARQLEISGTHFRRIFKRQTGMSPYHTSCRCESTALAKCFMERVQEVAAAVGFENPYHFSAAFKRKTGISPTQWRRRHEAVESISDHSGASSGDPLQETQRR